MLRRQHDGLEAHRLVILIAQGDLALGIRAQPVELALLAHIGLLLHQAVRQGDGSRHQHVGFVGGIAEHQALVAGALLALVLAVDALGDVRRLFADDVDDAAARAIETHVRGVVTDVQHNLADERLDVHPGIGGHFTGDHDDTRLDEGLAGNTAARVVLQDCIQHRIGNLVRDLVRVTFRDRLGGK